MLHKILGDILVLDFYIVDTRQPSNNTKAWIFFSFGFLVTLHLINQATMAINIRSHGKVIKTPHVINIRSCL